MSEALEVLSALPLFTSADEEQLNRVAAASFPRRLSRGQVLFTEGEASEHLFVVVSGHLKVLVGSERGDTLVLSVVGPGEGVGELSIIDGMPRSAGAEALDEVRLLCVPSAVLKELLATSPGFCLALAEELAQRLRVLTGAAADLVFLDLPRRLAKMLVGTSATTMQLPQAELAAQLGVTRPSLSRSLAGFQRRGWVEVSRGRVELLDRSALARFAES
jgi:CRP/FNR family cyclic AMP-dependent transcriptional regulator